jgi:hypothetical protein
MLHQTLLYKTKNVIININDNNSQKWNNLIILKLALLGKVFIAEFK